MSLMYEGPYWTKLFDFDLPSFGLGITRFLVVDRLFLSFDAPPS